MCTVYNFHAYTLRFRCLPRPWRARAWRDRRLKKGRHWRRRRTLISYLNHPSPDPFTYFFHESDPFTDLHTDPFTDLTRLVANRVSIDEDIGV